MNVAYRLVGSVAEAEDAVQEAFARWYALSESDRREVDSPPAWLVTVATRTCLDLLRSARARRERYVGEWLPEPVPAPGLWTSHAAAGSVEDPADRVSLDESLSMALLVVLETMTPAERVAFVLHDVFGYRFSEVAQIVGRTPRACTQLAHSARKRIRRARGRTVPREEHERVVASFKIALESGDLGRLIEILDPEVIAVGDGGGAVRAGEDPIRGAESVARHLLAIAELQPGMRLENAVANGRAGVLLVDSAGRTLAVMTLGIAGERVERIWAMRNPRKLTYWV